MGSCLSKRGSSSSSPTTDAVPVRGGSVSSNLKDICVDTKVLPEPQKLKEEETAAAPEEASGFVKKKEVFIIKHRKSHDRTPPESEKVSAAEQPEGSSTSKTDISDVRAVSIGASPIPRSQPTKEEEVDAILIQCGRLSHNSSGRKYSGSKRSYDFDHPSGDAIPADITSSDALNGEDERQLRRSQGSRSRRRTPSRERDQQRSGSRERAPGSRRVSRSPGRRSETNPNPNPTSSTENKPGKIVSVPATVNTGEAAAAAQQTGAVRRVSVKRNVNVNNEAAPRGSASPRPRSKSPARRPKESQQQQQQQVSLSRSSSRKAEQSPLRRNPLSDIDTNKITTCKIKENEVKSKAEIEEVGAAKTQQEFEKQTPRKLTRSRSSRRSYDNLELNLETNPTSSYTALLLEDIQNFHQKNTPPTPTTPFTLPPCVTKAHSIYQAVADMNSNAASSVSTAYSEEKKPQTSYQYSTNRFEFKSSSNTKDPFVESAVVVDDDLMEPSFHKYVTVKRGSIKEGEGDRDEIESSGSNSFMSGGTPLKQQQWDLPYEPGSVDSSDCWTSRSNATSDLVNDGRRKMNGKNRDAVLQQSGGGVARGRVHCR